jgi:IMP dehydrogenase
MRECLAFDDVLLVPVYSNKRSRLGPDVSTSTIVGTLRLEIPLISSPMDTVTELEMASRLGGLGGMGVLHRFMSVDDQIKMIRSMWRSGSFPIVPAIGVGCRARERFDALNDACGKYIGMYSIDIANGHSILMKEMIDYVSARTDKPIMAGNVATGAGYEFLARAGVSAVRVGIGGGSICKTRIQTGFGVPTLASVMDCYETKLKTGLSASIIADGGIRDPGDVLKSIVGGADAVICGGVFAGTKEAPGEVIIDNNGKAWKSYRGMASESVQIDKMGGLKKGTCAEGVSTLIPYKGSLERVINNFVGGIRSGLTYGNANNIYELRENAEFVRVTAAGLGESHAYGTRK